MDHSAEMLASALVGHLVGDYLLQNDWMALNKKRHSGICAIHAMIWTESVCLLAGWLHWPAFAILFVTHFIQDRTEIIKFWMLKINKQPQFYSGPCAPWSIIVVDNSWHIVTIWFVWRFAIQ